MPNWLLRFWITRTTSGPWIPTCLSKNSEVNSVVILCSKLDSKMEHPRQVAFQDFACCSKFSQIRSVGISYGKLSCTTTFENYKMALQWCPWRLTLWTNFSKVSSVAKLYNKLRGTMGLENYDLAPRQRLWRPTLRSANRPRPQQASRRQDWRISQKSALPSFYMINE